MKKNILVIVFSNLKHDARVKRQINALTQDYTVTVACHDADVDPSYRLVKFAPTNLTLFRKIVSAFLLLLRRFSIAHNLLHDYKSVATQLASRPFDLVIANDVETLPTAFQIARSSKSKLLFDAHEYAPRHFEDKRMWRIFFQNYNTWLCKKYIKHVDGMTTVGEGLAEEYEKHFGIKPQIVHNAPSYYETLPTPVSDTKIKLIHHGIANRSRRLDLMVELMHLLDERFTLDLMLLLPPSSSKTTVDYLAGLKQMAASNPRIRFIPAVKSDQIVNFINQYDIGVFLLPPVNFNYANTLPNKFFDFIQARLGVAIGPTPEMAHIVMSHKNGVVSNDFTAKSLAEKLNALTVTQIQEFKHNSDSVAKMFNAEKSANVIRSVVKNLID
jgi:hypothetical protein